MDPSSVDVDALTQFVQLLQQVDGSYHTLGLVGALGVFLTLAVRVLRMNWVQAMLPPSARWESLPRLGQVGIVFLLSLAGGAATALAGGMPWGSALTAGLSAAVAALGLNETTRAVAGPKSPAQPPVQ